MSVSRSSSDGNVSGETSQEGSPTRRSLSPKGSPARSREGSPDRRVEDKYFQAARMGKVKVVKEGLEGGVVTVDSFDSKGDTLMHVAAGQGHRNVVKELFRRGADPDCRNVAGVAAHEVATEHNYWELGDYMRERAGLEKLGPSKWKGEPTLALDEEALGEEMVRREKAAAVSEAWRHLEQVDFEMLLSAVDDAAKPGAANTHSDLVENVSELRTRLGDRARAEKLMEVVGKVWARGPLFDVDQGKMGEEVDLLVEKTGGRDVETLLDDLAAKEKMVEDVAKDKAAEKESAKVLVEMAALLAEVREELVGAKEGERKALQQAKAVSDLIQDLATQDLPPLTPPDVAEALVHHASPEDASVPPSALGALISDLVEKAGNKGGGQKAALKEAREEAHNLTEQLEEAVVARQDAEDTLRARIRELEGNSVSLGEVQKEADQARKREEALRIEYEDRLDNAVKHEAQLRTLQSAHQDLLLSRDLLAKEEEARGVEREREREEGEARRGALEAEIHRLEAERRVELAEDGGKMNDVRSALHVANKELARLSAEVRGSRIREAWETVISARDRCRAMKKGLRNLRKTTVAAAEQTREELRRAGEELLLLCSFILPLPHQAPEQVRVSKLTGPQLGAALRHMLSKYRSASLLARSLNAKAQAAKGALQVWCRGGGPGSLEKGEDALTTKAGGSKESSPNRLGGNGLLLNFRGEGCVSVVESSRGGLDRERGVKEFEFDAAFPPGTGQADIFSAAKDLVSTTLDGYKVSVIAYGPAGGGKTYSLFGSGGERGGGREAEAGLAHRFLSLVVEFAQEHAALLRIQVSLSAFEIHGDVMHDLLPRTAGKGAEDKEAAKHELKATVAADKGWGLGEVTIEGLSEHKVDAASKGDVLSSVLALALAAAEPGGGRAGASGVRREDRREEGASRGHVVVRVGVRSVATKPGGEVLNGKLTFVDLASSEPGLPGASEQGKHNRSLASLRDVFSAIASNKDRKHIPYRSSLLTKVLSDSLGGHARCLVLAAIPGASPHDNEIPRTSNHASKKSPTKAGKSDAGDGREKGGGGGGGKQSKDASLLWGVGGASGKSTLAVMTMVQEWRGVQLGSAPKHSERVPGEAIGGKGLEGRRSTDMDATGGMSKIIRASNDPAWFGSGSDDEGGGGGKGGGGREGGGGGGGGVGEEEVEELRREKEALTKLEAGLRKLVQMDAPGASWAVEYRCQKLLSEMQRAIRERDRKMTLLQDASTDLSARLANISSNRDRLDKRFKTIEDQTRRTAWDPPPRHAHVPGGHASERRGSIEAGRSASVPPLVANIIKRDKRRTGAASGVSWDREDDDEAGFLPRIKPRP